MKKVLFFLLWMGTQALYAQVKIGSNPTIINPNSLLELESANKGLLLPRLGLDSTSSFAPLTAHVAGMVVYNTDSSGTGTTGVTPGFYYNDGTRWVRLAGGGNAWQLLGNSATTAPAAVGVAVGAANFWGTTDAQNLAVATNDTVRAIFDTKGNLYGGNNITATGADKSLTWGNNVSTTAKNTLGVGSGNTLTGNYSAAIGQNDTVSGVGSFVQGTRNNVSGAYSVAFGGDDPAITSWDGGNTVSGEYSFAMGSGNKSTGRHSHTMGDVNTASGYSSFAGGELSNVTNQYAFAWGGGNQVGGNSAAAFGYGNSADGAGSFVAGGFNHTTASNCSVFGGNNVFTGGSPNTWVALDPMFQVGNGLAYNNRRNAFTILHNGYMAVGSHTTMPLATLHVFGNAKIDTLPHAALTDSILTDSAGFVRHRSAASLLNNAWLITGNTGTTPPTVVGGPVGTNNYWGTTDAKNLAIGTNGTTRMIFDQSGNAYGGTNGSYVTPATANGGNNRNFIWGRADSLVDHSGLGNANANAIFGAFNKVVSGGPLFGSTNVVGGSSNTVAASASAVFGNRNVDSALYTFMAGSNNILTRAAGNSVLAGDGNYLSGTYAAVFGKSNRDSANYTLVTGLNNSLAPTAAASMAIGNGNRVTGSGSGAVGAGNTVTRNLSYAFGVGNVVSDATAPANYVSSFAAGIDNRVLAHSSAAFGQENTLNSQHSFAAGYANIALSNASVVFGYANITPTPGGFVAGIGNAFTTTAAGPNTLALDDPYFQVGNGFSTLMNNARQNAFTVLFNGYTAIGSHTVKPTHTLEVNGQAKIDTLLAGLPTDRIVVADAAGVLKSITLDSLATSSVEPWLIQTTTSQATANTQNIYQMGSVGILTDSAISALDVRGAVRGGTPGMGTVGSNSAAFGTNNVASGQNAFAAGSNNTVSGSNASALGYNNTASGPNYSIALGYSNTVTGDAAAIGYQNNVAGNFAIGIGNGNILPSGAQYAAAIGQSNTISGQYAIGIGNSNTSSGTYAMTLGQSNTASGQYALAAGFGSKATGTGSVAIAENGISSGTYSMVVGVRDTASGSYSFALGADNHSSGDYSLSVGSQNRSLGTYSATLGQGNVAASNFELAGGRYNAFTTGTANTWVPTDALVQIGTGTDDANRANAITVLKSGYTAIGTHNTKPTSTLQVNGSMAAPLRIVTGDTTFIETDHTILKTGATPVTITLPPAGSCPGRMYRLVEFAGDGNASTITVSPAVQTYNGTSQYASTDFWEIHTNLTASGTNGTVHSVTFQSDGTNWYALGR